ncbi:MAG: zinc-dependent metalloprotease [Gammaproteobacteria bacterium]
MNIQKLISRLFILTVMFVLVVQPVNIFAQEEIEEISTEDETVDDKEQESGPSLKKCLMKAKSMKDKKNCQKENMQTVEEFIEDEGLKLIEGYLKIYSDEDAEAYFLKLDEEDINKQFLYFAYIMNAPQGSLLTGGLPSDGKVLEFRNFKKDNIGLYQINTSYMNGDDNNIGTSTITNITEAFIENFKPVARTENSVLISVNNFLMSEKIESLSYVPQEYREYVSVNYGRPDPSKTLIDKVFNNKTNTAVEVTFAYTNKSPNSDAYSVAAVTDPRYLSVTGRHIFIKMPDEGYEPRINDHRIGYFVNKSTDLTSYENYPNFALINKWRLVKKDPSAALSEPVEPIVYWVENTTPEEIVPAVVAGIENWNIAFEEAGFKNAIVAKIQPKDATWDAADYDYNVVRWSSEPDGRLLGIGPSVSNPLTGEIISADIVNKLLAVKLGHNYRKLYGYTEDNDPLMQYITNLTLHEVGHTLGLRHNFRGSQLYSPTEIHNKDITGNTIMSSVMDYDPINVAPEGVEQGIFFSTVPGIYDKWAIKFGYTPNLSSEERKELLLESVKRELTFGTDDEAMSYPGNNIDPRTKRYDMSSDPIAYAADITKIIDKKINELPNIYSDEETFNNYTDAFYRFFRTKGRFLETVAQQIGGVYINKIASSQKEYTSLEAVPYEKQKQAMSLLAEKVFANGAMNYDQKILSNLIYERDTKDSLSEDGNNNDPDFHALVLSSQKNILRNILHPNVMKRLINSSLYGNEYMPSEVLADLNSAIFISGEEPDTFKMSLQSSYVDLLLSGFKDGPYDEVSKGEIFNALQDILDFTRKNKFKSSHYSFLYFKVNSFFEKA